MLAQLALSVLLPLSGSMETSTRDWTPADHMSYALAEAMATARVVSDTTSFGYAEGVALVGVYLQPGQSYSFYRSFSEFGHYSLVSGGDEDCNDIDLKVHDSDGNLVASDTSVSREAELVFRPPASGEYEITLTLYGADCGSFVAAAILEDGGYDVPVSNLTAASSNLMELCRNAARVGENRGDTAAFLDLDQQLAVWGTVLDPDSTASLTNVVLGDRPVALMAAADGNAGDLDLHLSTTFGLKVDQDIEMDSVPVILHEPTAAQRYTVELENVGGARRTFAMVAVVQYR